MQFLSNFGHCAHEKCNTMTAIVLEFCSLQSEELHILSVLRLIKNVALSFDGELHYPETIHTHALWHVTNEIFNFIKVILNPSEHNKINSTYNAH